jgi:hypothetical protein
MRFGLLSLPATPRARHAVLRRAADRLRGGSGAPGGAGRDVAGGGEPVAGAGTAGTRSEAHITAGTGCTNRAVTTSPVDRSNWVQRPEADLLSKGNLELVRAALSRPSGVIFGWHYFYFAGGQPHVSGPHRPCTSSTSSGPSPAIISSSFCASVVDELDLAVEPLQLRVR